MTENSSTSSISYINLHTTTSFTHKPTPHLQQLSTNSHSNRWVLQHIQMVNKPEVFLTL